MEGGREVRGVGGWVHGRKMRRPSFFSACEFLCVGWVGGWVGGGWKKKKKKQKKQSHLDSLAAAAAAGSPPPPPLSLPLLASPSSFARSVLFSSLFPP